LKVEDKVENILKEALKLEERAIEIYSKMKDESNDPEVIELLEFLISQEEEHRKIINDRLRVAKFLRK